MSAPHSASAPLPRLLSILRVALPAAGIAALLGLAVYLWAFNGMAQLTAWAAGEQRAAQNAMAGTLRALRAGEPGALATLMGLSFAYGLFHAAGPGHGKLLIGGYGVSQKVTALRLSGLALLSSLAQSASAVLLVTAGIAALDWSRARMVGLAEDWLAPASYAAIGLVGAWLALRGLRHLWQRLRARAEAKDHHHHHHVHDHAGTCSCGHRHGPSPEEAARISSWREALLLIGAIAIRPCTGALFLLILTWRMDILAAGIAGTFAMGLGVASVTIGVALATVFLRAGIFDQATETGSWDIGPSPLLSLVEILAGALIASAATGLFLHMI